MTWEFWPYIYDGKLFSSTNVAISKTTRAISYTRNGKDYVVVNDKAFGPYDVIVRDLQVTDSFWGFVVYNSYWWKWSNTGTNKVIINGQEISLRDKSDNIYINLYKFFWY